MISTVFVSLSDISLSIMHSRSISVVASGKISFSWLNNILLCICIFSRYIYRDKQVMAYKQVVAYVCYM